MRAFQTGRGGRPPRLGYGRIFHEANAHSPVLTTRADFERLHVLAGEALERATRGCAARSSPPSCRTPS